jgi:hypothetical protein
MRRRDGPIRTGLQEAGGSQAAIHRGASVAQEVMKSDAPLGQPLHPILPFFRLASADSTAYSWECQYHHRPAARRDPRSRQGTTLLFYPYLGKDSSSQKLHAELMTFRQPCCYHHFFVLATQDQLGNSRIASASGNESRFLPSCRCDILPRSSHRDAP